MTTRDLFEALETRRLMSTFTVTTTTDTGMGSLRFAILSANSAPGADTIDFDPSLAGQTIALTGGQMTISDDVTITGAGGPLTISDNSTSRVFFIGSGISVTINAVTITGGAAGPSGGGAIANTGTLTLTNSTITGNSGTNGGGIYNTGTLTVVNSTISGNTSQQNGGGINNLGTLSVMNSTITGNTSAVLGQGGGITNSNNGSATIKSSIVAGNTGGDIAGTLAPGSTNNLVQNGATAGGLTNGVNGNLVGVDPLLGPLAVNGGPTRTHALLTGSPAIDKGSNPNSLTTDQRGAGFARVSGLGADIGAFEVVNATPPADAFIDLYNQNAVGGLVDGDWIADSLNAAVSNVATSDAYWGARNNWFQDSQGNVWSLWQGGDVHLSQTHPGQHVWVLTNLTDAAGLTGTMNFAPGSLSGITTGWNAFNIQGIQDGKLTALWWSPAGSAGTYIDTDGQTKQGGGWGVRGNGWSLSSISDAATAIGGAITTPPAAFLAYSESQGNGRTEFDPRLTRFISNGGMSVVVVDVNHRVYAITFSTSQRAIAGARPDLNNTWVLEPLSEVPSLADYGLSGQVATFEQAYIDAAT